MAKPTPITNKAVLFISPASQINTIVLYTLYAAISRQNLSFCIRKPIIPTFHCIMSFLSPKMLMIFLILLSNYRKTTKISQNLTKIPTIFYPNAILLSPWEILFPFFNTFQIWKTDGVKIVEAVRDMIFSPPPPKK